MTSFFAHFLLILLMVLPSAENNTVVKKAAADKIRGVSFVGPPRPFASNPIPAIDSIHADWLAVIPFAYSRQGEPNVMYDVHRWQWWGERPEGVREAIRLAQQHKKKVLLKPHVWVPGSWSGFIDFDSDQEWVKWEKGYEKYILSFADMARELEVDMFCIGNEFKTSIRKRPAFWRQLIEKTRARYNGPVIYAANWDFFEEVPFWEDLDYAGVNAYFPLINDATPRKSELIKAWKPVVKDLRIFHQTHQKPVIFTEFGYLSVDQCAHKTWELEENVRQRRINEIAQANALDALFDVFWEEPYWRGGFIWKWFPNMQGHEGYPERDYTPQGKLGQEILKKWYQK